jgi:hypothetical protein
MTKLAVPAGAKLAMIGAGVAELPGASRGCGRSLPGTGVAMTKLAVPVGAKLAMIGAGVAETELAIVVVGKARVELTDAYPGSRCMAMVRAFSG